MKFPHSTKNSAGIGLIEVLVTTVVVAVGLLAVASLQTNLLSSSSTNKTRAEAQVLANTKIEELRDTIEKSGATGYAALASSAANESIAGVTETYSRSWVVTDQTNPTRKQVSVTVSWPTGSVAVQSVIAFDGVGNSVLAAKSASQTGASVNAPSTNANSSDDISTTINLTTPGTTGALVTVNGKTYIVQNDTSKATATTLCSSLGSTLTSFENSLYTRRVDHDGVTGNGEAIELYEYAVIDGVAYCTARVRYNGGIIIPIRGIVHSGATGSQHATALLDVNLFTFNTSETGTYCVFTPSTGAKSAPYVCYVGGNCKYGPNGTTTGNPVTECPNPAVSAAIVGEGGWRGKVGLLGVAAGGYNVCFSEEILGSPATLDTARNYYTLRNGINEGMNKPYSCHDFLIIDGQSTNAKVHSQCVTQASAIGGFTLASKTIQRNITTGNNEFDSTIDTTYCASAAPTAYTITGTITGAAVLPTVTITDGTITNNCTATTSTYSCLITTTATAVTVSGTYNSQPKSCAPLTIASTTTTVTDCLLAFTTMPVYTITGHISATTAAAANAVSLTVVDGASSVNCTNNLNYTNGYNTYTCSISTLSTTGIVINAKTSTGYAVSPATYTVPTLSGITSAVTVPSTANDFVASVVPTYTISGNIALGNNVDNLTSLTTAITTGSGSCTVTAPSGGWSKNKTGSYSCTVYAGSSSLTEAISPTCSNTKSGNTNAFKKYQMSSTGVTTTVGTGQLVIPLGTVSGNQTHDISILESTTGC